MTVDDRIVALSDQEALTLLRRFSRAQPKLETPTILDASISTQIREVLAGEPEGTPGSAGDLARASLRLSANDPEHHAGIQALLDHSQTETFTLVETALTIPLVLVALQTHVKFEREKSGKWTFKIEKKPTDQDLLKELLKKLLAFSK